ncbi:MAG: hypothetical protein CL922_03150 [Deltaproteobacteria bacterium]|nr:hypothetical protein [Deltaproteobacteria bacterium]
MKNVLLTLPLLALFATFSSAEEIITKVNATTKSFWSYKPLRRPSVPKIGNPAWSANPIDAFIYKRLEAKRLKPNGPASRRELIRRASFDITGLPPTLEEVEAFENDKSPGAWEKVIDRLLASPHYGEKWARHWLDIVRYAESNGFERDSDKPHIWRYRDYVIDALNMDLPYDQFLLQQLAGDEIEKPTSQSMIATGFHRLMQWDDEPADRLLHLFDNLDDDLRITAEGMLGMTVGCARCHDHKGDPISQEDYYSFMAFFRGMKQPGKGGANVEKVGGGEGDASYQAALQKHDAEGERFKAGLKDAEKQMGQQLIKAFPSLEGRLSSSDGDFYVLLGDGREADPAQWFYTTSKPAANWSAVNFRAENQKWKKGRAGFGKPGTPGVKIHTQWDRKELWAQGTFLLESIPEKLRLSLIHDEDFDLYLNGQHVLKRSGVIGSYKEFDADKKFLSSLQTGRNVVTVHVRQKSGRQSFDFGVKAHQGEKFTIDVALSMSKAKGVDKGLIEKRKKLKEQIAQHAQRRPKPTSVNAQVVQEHGKTPPALHIHMRGNPHAKDETVVTTRIPGIFGAEELKGTPPVHGRNTSGRRLALAQWVIKPDNPRTSRVIMNRLWQHHFGRGICATPNDFGYLGERPSHPVLLDWLATELVTRKWSLKAMHKVIMLSQAYQMSSRGEAAALSKDPDNKWFWRFNMRRLTAEELRDSVLAATGRLNRKMGGPSIYIKLSAEVLATSSTKGGKWGNSPEEEQTRRSVYIKVKRSLVPPILQDFDLADTDGTCPVRFRSILPTQALAMMNSSFVNEEAVSFAKRLRAEAPDDPRRQIGLALEIALSRPATARELDYGMEFVEVMMREHKLSSEEAFNRFALLVLNLNEFFFLD